MQWAPGVRITGGRAVLASLALVVGLTTAPVAHAGSTVAPVGASAASLLPAPAQGAAAVRALGGSLEEAARRNQLTTEELVALLSADPTMWLAPSGHLYAVDPAPSLPDGGPAAAPRTYPYDQTFQLHSRPGADRTIYLDFDGEVVSGTAWNTSDSLSTDPQPAFDTDGNGAHWSNAEMDVVQSVYDRVAEDYAPFDVDVTTEPPAPARVARSSASDEIYGTRVLISPSSEAATKICGGSCGGVAYVGIFDLIGNTYYQPAWVFPHLLSNNAKYIAEAVSHESGHNLGLNHDGTSSASYYTGQANWAPIMGVGYGKPLVQWSQGEYSDANNLQDDLAVISSNGLPSVSDDHGGSIGTATGLGSATASGLIGTRGDADMFAVTRACDLSLTASVAPAPVSPNLDISLQILDEGGTVLAADDPTSTTVNSDTAGGLSAAVTMAAPAGTYYVRVDGVGVGSPSTSYSDYASLGRYTLTVTPCPTPSAPTNVVVTKDDTTRTATISWDAPATDGGFPVTGYRVTRDSRSAAGAGPQTIVTAPEARSLSFTNLGADSRYRLTVAAVNTHGPGPSVGAAVRVRPGNLLVNPGFEADRNRDRHPDGWRAATTFTRSAAAAKQGRFSGRHQSARNATSLTHQRIAHVVGGSGYRFAGWVKIPATSDRFGYTIRVRWQNQAGATIRVDRVKVWHAGTHGWRMVRKPLASPLAARSARLDLVATSLAGTVHVDRLLLRRR